LKDSFRRLSPNAYPRITRSTPASYIAGTLTEGSQQPINNGIWLDDTNGSFAIG